MRPRILTVDRRNPSQVQIRVLRRFTYTEVDSDAQYDRLLSAYTVAEWSEPLFNNRALFSDYYLNERLPELPEWNERPEAVYHRVREIMPRPSRRIPERAEAGLHRLIRWWTTSPREAGHSCTPLQGGGHTQGGHTCPPHKG